MKSVSRKQRSNECCNVIKVTNKQQQHTFTQIDNVISKKRTVS